MDRPRTAVGSLLSALLITSFMAPTVAVSAAPRFPAVQPAQVVANKLTVPAGLENAAEFGASVAVDADWAIVGAPSDDATLGADSGVAYIESGW